VYEIRGTVLPEREERSFWIDGDRLRVEPVPDAELIVDGGWLLPGLVDVHTHPGAEEPGDPFDEEALRSHLLSHRDAGVLLVRTPGSAARIPDWVHSDGAPADIVVYPSDPTVDPAVLRHPSRIILRGQIVR
jgi:imidazolonepropionase-like amidohydrolase